MIWQRLAYTTPLIAAAAVSVMAAVYVWRRRHTRSWRTSIVLLLASAEWMVTYALELSSDDLSRQIFWDKLQWLGACIIPTAWVIYALQFTGHERWITLRNIILLGILPIAILGLGFTNEAHGLIWSGFTQIPYGPFLVKCSTFGIGFWIFFVYSYAEVLFGIFWIIQALVLSGRLYRWQATAVLITVLMAWLMSAASYIVDILPFPQLDLTPIALSVMVPIIAWTLYHLQRQDIVPVAHHTVIESMRDGVIITDAQGCIIDINAAVKHIIGHPHSKVTGLPLGEVWPDLLDLLGRAKVGTPSEMVVEQGDGRRIFDIGLSPLTNWRGQLLSQVIVLRDITERKRAEEEILERKKTELNTFINNIPDFAWIKDEESRFISVNKAFADAVGMDPEYLIHHSCEVCFGEEEGKKFREDDLKVMESRGQMIIEEKIIDSKKREIWLETIKSPISGPSGKILGTVGISRNITDRKRMEEALRESENKYKTIFETTGTATAIVDEDTTIELINSELEKLSGYTKEEIEGKKSWTEFVVKEDLERLKEYHRLRRTGPNAVPKNYEFRAIDKRGNIKDVFITVDLIPGTTKSVTSLLDITDSKRANEMLKESERKLRLFSSHLISAQEVERRRISKELHDDLGQVLIALKLRLGSIRRKLGKEQIAFINECESIQNDVDQIIDNVRRLSLDLGPYTLEHLGLWAALRSLTEEFAKYYHVEISFDILDSDSPLPTETQLNLFRIFQEAFTNIQKHAHAANIWVVISEKNGSLSFLIEDDGRGFNLTEERERNTIGKGLGLAIMEERIRMLGGTLDLWSQEGKGTKISFRIPVCKEGDEA